jgi:1,4-alpha-glucan branching enzyme
MKKTALKKIQFQLTTEPGSQVFVAGTFNNWNPTANQLQDNPGSGHCLTTLRIPTGTHEYKFVVDGEWRADPNCPDWVLNDCGSLNSVVHV